MIPFQYLSESLFVNLYKFRLNKYIRDFSSVKGTVENRSRDSLNEGSYIFHIIVQTMLLRTPNKRRDWSLKKEKLQAIYYRALV